MIATLIGVASLAALAQFVYYCRSTLASVKGVELSDRVLSITGLGSATLAPSDFERFFQLVQLCPEQRTDGARIRAVALYYGLLRDLAGVSKLMPRFSSWVEQEQKACSHFVAVVLDQRISSSRSLFLQQAADRP